MHASDANEKVQVESDLMVEALGLLKADMRRNEQILEATSNELRRQKSLAEQLEQMIKERGTRSVLKPNSAKRPAPLYALVLERARVYMELAGRPLTRQEILASLVREGHVLEVNDPPHFVGKTIWKSSEFVAYNEGYWPADMPSPAGATLSHRRKGKKEMSRK